MSEFLDRDPKVQSLLIQVRHWTRKECLDFLKEQILPNHFHELELQEIVQIIETNTDFEIKSALISILQNTDPRKLYQASSFN